MLVGPLDDLKPHHRGRTEADLSKLLVFGTVLFDGLEALGGFYCGRRGSDRTFKEFVKDFMDPIYGPHTAELREDFRNGLAHGFAVKHGGFEFLVGQSLRVDQQRGVQIDPDSLLRDFKRALRAYFRRLRVDGQNSSVGRAFQTRFREVFGV